VNPRVTIIEHTADVGIEVEAESLEELFEVAAAAMFGLMYPRLPDAPTEERLVRVEGEEPVELLVNWLNELLYLAEAEGLVFGRFEVRVVRDVALRARAWGVRAEDMDPPVREIKAATYHMLRLEKVPGGHVARIIFDL